MSTTPPLPTYARCTPGYTSSWLDARPVDPRDLERAGALVERFRPVWVRRWGCWHPALLRGWRRLPRGGWAAWLRISVWDDVWVHYQDTCLRPIRPLTADRHAAAYRP
ncbi:hypothetical protein [Kitasatospora sp. NPDC004289]